MIPRVVQTMKLLPESYQSLVPGAMPDGKLPVSKRTVDETKVTDHHAIIPTAKRVDPASFTEEERQLYDLVARRMLQAFYPACEYDATKVITQVGQHRFRTNGRVVIHNGWRDVAALANPPAAKTKKKAKPAEGEEEVALPPLAPGDTRTVKSAAIKQDATKPPAQHTDASLLAAMENAGRELDDEELARQMKGSGIGTPATRASIIERLMQVGYAQRKGKTILATDKGVKLIAIMPQEIASPEMTGRWELALSQITDGKQDADKFMESIRKFSTFLVGYAKNNRESVTFPDDGRRKKRQQNLTARGHAVEGAVCPLCREGAVLENQRSFFCARMSEGCQFTLWKDCLARGGGPELNEKLLRLLLEKKEIHGSTGAIVMDDSRIAFWPTGAQAASIVRNLAYVKR